MVHLGFEEKGGTRPRKTDLADHVAVGVHRHFVITVGAHGLGDAQANLPLHPGKAGAAKQVLAKPGKILFSL